MTARSRLVPTSPKSNSKQLPFRLPARHVPRRFIRSTSSNVVPKFLYAPGLLLGAFATQQQKKNGANHQTPHLFYLQNPNNKTNNEKI
jgi:hypothetical protein